MPAFRPGWESWNRVRAGRLAMLLATAIHVHPESSLPWISRALLPLLERGRLIPEKVTAFAPDRVLP